MSLLSPHRFESVPFPTVSAVVYGVDIMSASPDVVMRQWFTEVWNERREDAIDRLMAPGAKVHGLAGGPIVGPEGFKPFYRTFCGAFADLRVEIVQTLVDGDRVAAHCHVTGRHVGDALGGKATGRAIDLWGTTIGRIENGRIVEGWNCFDFLTMYQQIGWVQSPVVG
jgi:predicted ester cyclase